MGPKCISTDSAEGGFRQYKETKDFDTIICNMQRQGSKTHKKQMWVENYKHCRRQCSIYGKIHGGVERPSTSRQCAGQCIDSGRNGDHQGVVGHSMMSGGMMSSSW